MNQRQTQRLNAIVAAFVENMKSFTEDFAASSDEKDDAIAKQLQRESALLRENDKLREDIEGQAKRNRELNEKVLELLKEIEGLKAEKEELEKKAPKIRAFGKYRSLEEKPVNEAKKGFRIKED